MSPTNSPQTVTTTGARIYEKMTNRNENSKDPEVIKAETEKRRSRVRIRITYGAGCYVFLGSFLLMATGFFHGSKEEMSTILAQMKDAFAMVLPIATGILTYWFADRAVDKRQTRETGATDTNNSRRAAADEEEGAGTAS